MQNAARSSTTRAILRKAAIGLTTAVTFASAATLVSIPASAADPSSNCSAIKDKVKGTVCEYNTLKQREKDANRRDAAARRETTEARREEADALAKDARNKAVIECTKFLSGLVNDKKFTREEILQQAGGKLTEANACPTARHYGYTRKEALAAPRADR